MILFNCVPIQIGLLLKERIYSQRERIVILSSFAITSMVIALHSLSFLCLLSVILLWTFPTVDKVGLQRVFPIFPDHTR